MLTFATLDEARNARGLRLVVTATVPSPWSEAAKGCFDATGIDYLAVRLTPRDTGTRAWTGHHNAPVALYDDEPPRTGWADILALAQRLSPNMSLVPTDEEPRIQMFGLAHAILGEGELIWCARLLMIHAGLITDGQRGFPARAARYLAPKYGYPSDPAAAASKADAARARVLSIWAALATRLQDQPRYCCGDRLTALDIYLAVALNVFAPLPEAFCPMNPDFRRAYESWDPDISSAIPAKALAHRDFIYTHHLVLPVRF